jgi:D-alanyl-D-alanine carboxypeptidase
MNGESLTSIEKRLHLPKELHAPVEINQIVGTLEYYHGHKKLGEINIIADKFVDKAKYSDYVKRVWLAWMM